SSDVCSSDLACRCMIVAMSVAGMATLRMFVSHDASPLRLLLSNADLALFTTDECRDMSDLVRRQAGNRCHVAELPVVGAHTVRYRQLKGDIGVMTGFVDLMEHGWPLVRALEVGPMASGTVLCVESLSLRRIGHQPRRGLRDLPALRRCARNQDA